MNNWIKYSLVTSVLLWGSLQADIEKSEWVKVAEVLLGDTDLVKTEVEIQETTSGFEMRVPGERESLEMLWPTEPELVSSQDSVVTYASGQEVGTGREYTLFIFYNPERQGLDYPRTKEDLKPGQISASQARSRLDQARKVVAIQLINRLKAQMAEEGRLSVQLVDEEHESEKSYSVLTYEGRVQFDAEPSRDVPIRLQMIVSPEAIYLIVSQGPNAVLQLGPAKFYTSSV